MSRVRVKAQVEITYRGIDREKVAPADLPSVVTRKLAEALQEESDEVTVQATAEDA